MTRDEADFSTRDRINQAHSLLINLRMLMCSYMYGKDLLPISLAAETDLKRVIAEAQAIIDLGQPVAAVSALKDAAE